MGSNSKKYLCETAVFAAAQLVGARIVVNTPAAHPRQWMEGACTNYPPTSAQQFCAEDIQIMQYEIHYWGSYRITQEEIDNGVEGEGKVLFREVNV